MSKICRLLCVVSVVVIVIYISVIAGCCAQVQSSPDERIDYCESKDEDTGLDIKSTTVSVVIEFLGAFLGVLSAIGLNHHTNKKQYKELNSSLYKELLLVNDDLTKRNAESQEYYRYSTPVWDINLAAGNLSLLTNGPIRKEYIDIYSKIQYAQELEREYVHARIIEKQESCSFLAKYIDKIDVARNREAEEIKTMIGRLTLKR